MNTKSEAIKAIQSYKKTILNGWWVALQKQRRCFIIRFRWFLGEFLCLIQNFCALKMLRKYFVSSHYQPKSLFSYFGSTNDGLKRVFDRLLFSDFWFYIFLDFLLVGYFTFQFRVWPYTKSIWSYFPQDLLLSPSLSIQLAKIHVNYFRDGL